MGAKAAVFLVGCWQLRWLCLLSFFALVACNDQPSVVVEAQRYDAFWLWAGVKPQPVLKTVKTVYLHFGEVKASPEGQLVVMRPNAPRLGNQRIWLVVRAETLQWNQSSYRAIFSAMDHWATENNLAGLQIDFDSQTRDLDRYAIFLGDLRQKLPGQYRLSVTGLLDWSANGDPAGLAAVRDVVDEIVVQTYQGRKTIRGYERYIGKLARLNMPFRVGLVQGGEWNAPKSLRSNPNFRGYVVFLVNPKAVD